MKRELVFCNRDTANFLTCTVSEIDKEGRYLITANKPYKPNTPCQCLVRACDLYRYLNKDKLFGTSRCFRTVLVKDVMDKEFLDEIAVNALTQKLKERTE